MTTITIPTKFGYPKFDIYINGKKYTLQSGVEITVEDNVAEVIENALDLAPKYSKNLSRLAQLAEGSITEITADDLFGIETIAAYVFSQCYSLKTLEFSDSIKVISKSAFASCTKLERVRFGYNSKINQIGVNVFNYCTSLKRVYLPPKPPTLENANAFGDINTACVFYCKSQESLNAYKAAANWSTLTGTYSFVVESK